MIFIKKTGFLILFCFLIFESKSQSSKIDSLEAILKAKDLSVQNKIKTLNDLSELLVTNEPGKGILYGEQALELSEQINQPESIAIAHCNIGEGYYYLGNFSLSADYYLQSLSYFENLKPSEMLGEIYNNLGCAYGKLNENEKSIYFNKKAYEIREILKDTIGMAQSLNNLGARYSLDGDYVTSMNYLKKALKIREKLNDSKGIAVSLNNIGSQYFEQKMLDSALFYFDKSLAICKDMDLSFSMVHTYTNIASVYIEKKQFDIAEENLNLALQESNKFESGFLKSIIFFVRSKLYEQKEDYKSSLEYFKKFKTIKDSIYNIENRKQLNEVSVIYETEKKERKIQHQQQIIVQKNKSLMIMWVSSCIVAVLLILLFYQYRRKVQTYKNLVKQNLEIALREKEDNSVSMTIPSHHKKMSSLEKTQQKELYQELIKIMEKEKPYLDKNLTIESLANMLNTNRTYLSLTIKNIENTNFNGFINHYRIKEARQMLIDEKYGKYSIEGIAGMIGFNSKSTFNASFKQITGLTPTYFKRSVSAEVKK